MREFTGSTAYQVTEKTFGVSTRLIESTQELDTTVSQILPNNPRRLFWLVCNRGMSAIAIGFTPQVTIDTGLYIAANGGTASMVVTEDGEAVTYPVYGVANLSPNPILIIEVVSV